MHTFLSILPPSAYRSIPALLGPALALCFLFKLICSPDDLSFSAWTSILSLSHLSLLLILSPYTGGLKVKGSKLAHTHTHTPLASSR